MDNKIAISLIIFAFISSGLLYRQLFSVRSNPNLDLTTGDIPENAQKDTPEQPTTKTDDIKNPDQSKILDLSNQELQKLPSSTLKLSGLEELNISNNKITGALPAEIKDLRNLRILDASDNLMTGVPAEVGQLQNLEILDLSNNKLTGLPYELGNLQKLKWLNLSGNDYAKQDLEIIKNNLPAGVEIIL